MKKLTIGFFILTCVGTACADDIVSQVRSSVSSVVSALPDGRRGSPEYIREFGVPLRRCPSYQDLVGLVSSNQDYLRLGKKCAEVDSGGRSALALSLCVNLIH